VPIYEFKCIKCEAVTESVMKPWSKSDEEYFVQCSQCGGKAYKTLSLFGGYQIKGDNSASERPRQAGSFKKK
jgi:putative FmdB family regulatory protein